MLYRVSFDGDTKSYALVVEKDHYPGKLVKKLECVGHIQKRVGARCCKMKQEGAFKNIYTDEVDPKTRKKK